MGKQLDERSQGCAQLGQRAGGSNFLAGALGMKDSTNEVLRTSSLRAQDNLSPTKDYAVSASRAEASGLGFKRNQETSAQIQPRKPGRSTRRCNGPGTLPGLWHRAREPARPPVRPTAIRERDDRSLPAPCAAGF